MVDNELTVVCAWCTAVVQQGTARVSHGICVDCAMTFLSRLPDEYLSSIADSDGKVTLFSGHKLSVRGTGSGDPETAPGRLERAV